MDSIHIPYPINKLNQLKLLAIALIQQDLNIFLHYQDPLCS